MRLILLVSLAALATVSHAVTAYKWTDKDGQVHYTDQPPPPAIKKVEEKKLGRNSIETSTMNFALQQAVDRFPVTLYVTDCGDPCSQAKQYLQLRGIPYAEKDPQNLQEAANFRKLTNNQLQVPFLVVGEQKIKGFDEATWATTLDAAGYPRKR